MRRDRAPILTAKQPRIPHPTQRLGEHCNRCPGRKKLGSIVICLLVCVVWLLLRSVQKAAARTMGAGTSHAVRAHDAAPGSRPRPIPRAMLTDRRRRHMTPDMRTSRAASRQPSQTIDPFTPRLLKKRTRAPTDGQSRDGDDEAHPGTAKRTECNA